MVAAFFRAILPFMSYLIEKLARVFAILGGIALSTLIIMTCVSIMGRSLNSFLHSDFVQAFAPDLANTLIGAGIGPINGDFELVEAGMAFTIFAFLPLCQIAGSHASVDIVTSKLPIAVNRFLRAVIEIIFAAILILIAVKLFEGMVSKRNSGQTTLLLQYPVWWGYAASVPGAIAAAVVGAYVAACRVIELFTGTVVIPIEQEASH